MNLSFALLPGILGALWGPLVLSVEWKDIFVMDCLPRALEETNHNLSIVSCSLYHVIIRILPYDPIPGPKGEWD